MTIIEALKNSVETITGLPFIYGSPESVNRQINDTELPCVYAYLLQTTAVEDTNGILHERMTLAVFFVNKTDFAPDDMENEVIINRMKRAAFRWWVGARSEWVGIRPIAFNEGQRVYQQFDDIVTGYAANVTIEEIAGVSICTEDDDEEPETPETPETPQEIDG